MNIKCTSIELVDISQLKPSPMNPNKHTIDQIKRLASIIEYQGFRSPIKVSRRSGYITSGHGRLAAARSLGMRQVPVSYQDYDSDDQELADIIADNAIAKDSWAELDLSFISSEVVPSFDPSFNLDLLGLTNFEIDPPVKEEKKPESKHLKCPSCGYKDSKKAFQDTASDNGLDQTQPEASPVTLWDT